jgi:hypothetical protein
MGSPELEVLQISLHRPAPVLPRRNIRTRPWWLTEAPSEYWLSSPEAVRWNSAQAVLVGHEVRAVSAGSRLPAPRRGALDVGRDAPVTVRLEVTGAPRCTVRFLTDQGVLFSSEPLPVPGARVVEWRITPTYAACVRAELRREAAVGPLPGALAAFANPVFLGRLFRGR